MVLLLEAAEVFKKANTQREETSPPVNEENALVLHASVKKCSEENTSKKKVSDDEPPGQLTNEDVMAQLKEMKILVDLKLKTLGFSEWLEVHALAFKSKGKSIDLLLQSLIAKFQWVLTQAKKIGVPPPPELLTFGISVDVKKRKRSSEILHEILEEIHVTWAHLEKKRTRLPLYTKSLKKLCIQSVEMTSRVSSDGVRTFEVTSQRSGDGVKSGRPKETLEDFVLRD
ncbi:hypothetical protein Tco_0717186 [Tanacetum coccineum]